MTECAVYDIPCVANSFTEWLYGMWNNLMNWLYNLVQPFWDFLNVIISGIDSGINAILTFITELYNMLSTVVSFLTGFLEIFNVNPTAGLIIATILMIISLIIFIRIYNILADIEIFGWKLPRIPI